jgi:4-diphosphocytidyl-2-C-methyl-D-erythritol kinase
MQVRAPAKINLNLRVLARDETSGYHEIETRMAPLSLADELEVELTEDPYIKLECNDASIGPAEKNLAWRAAELFLRESGASHGAKIVLRKLIPHGAGLGGGSSDAAAVLNALNRLSRTPFSPQELEKLAAKLGSDIPFFIRGRSAIARGRGEILDENPLPRPLDLLLLKPPFGIDTAWAYRHWNSTGTVPSRWTAPQLFDGLQIFNDLERAAFAKYLLLPAIKEWLLDHSLVGAAGMSGSGSTVFAILRDARGAESLALEAKASFGDTLWTAACSTTS